MIDPVSSSFVYGLLFCCAKIYIIAETFFEIYQRNNLPSKHPIKVYTDGSYKNGIGGGYGIVIKEEGKPLITIAGGDMDDNTAPRMEMIAIIKSLQFFREPTNIEVYSDSLYTIIGMKTDLARWGRMGWKNNLGEDIKNQDLWNDLEWESIRHNIRWEWIKGHSGDWYNDLADRMAKNGSMSNRLGLKPRES